MESDNRWVARISIPPHYVKVYEQLSTSDVWKFLSNPVFWVEAIWSGEFLRSVINAPTKENPYGIKEGQRSSSWIYDQMRNHLHAMKRGY